MKEISALIYLQQFLKSILLESLFLCRLYITIDYLTSANILVNIISPSSWKLYKEIPKRYGIEEELLLFRARAILYHCLITMFELTILHLFTWKGILWHTRLIEKLYLDFSTVGCESYVSHIGTFTKHFPLARICIRCAKRVRSQY